MRVKAPSDVVEYIREKFTLAIGKVIKHDGTVPSFTIINKRNYSMSYIKDVLEGKDPDLSVLFDRVDGKLYRNQDPVWAMYKGTKVSEKGAKICGVLVTQEGIKEILERPVMVTQEGIKEILERPVFKKIEPKHIELKQATSVLEPLVASEYERWCIKDRFHLIKGEVIYSKSGKPFGTYTSINNMRYSKGYVQQVLENKNPDVSDLFEFREGIIYRSQDPIWGQAKGYPFKYTKVCGAIFVIEGYVMPEQKPVEYLGDPD